MQREELKELLKEVLKTKDVYYINSIIQEIQEEDILKLFDLKSGNVVKYCDTIGVVSVKANELYWKKLKKNNELYQYETYLCSSYGLGKVTKLAETYDEYLQTLNK